MQSEPERDMTFELDLRRLKWLAILAPILFLGAVELLREGIYPSLFHAWPGYVLLGGIVLVGTLFFAEAIFSVIEQMQRRLRQQNQELIALQESGLAITSELELESVLQIVVDESRELVGARYGAISLISETGVLSAFITSGITAEERERIGPIPAGHGLLGAVLADATAIRLEDLTKDSRSVGFPPHHPPMYSLLAVPILSQGVVLGSIYLTEKQTGSQFDEADQQRLERFATQAALAIENARLHQQVRALATTEERERIAREMHDSIAQVLGYVNTKAQAAQALLETGRNEQATEQIAQLSQAAREAYADVRENILGLRTSLGPERGFYESLVEYLERWQDHSGVTVEFRATPERLESLNLTPLAELQLLRIVQEALTNVRKHARSPVASVSLTQSDGVIEASIRDTGSGFNPHDASRSEFPQFGLATMRERAESVGGNVEICSTPGKGTVVTARIPL